MHPYRRGRRCIAVMERLEANLPQEAVPPASRAEDPRSPLFVERRAQRRPAEPTRPRDLVPRRRWLAALLLVPVAMLAAGPVAALVCVALLVGVAQAAALVVLRGRNRELGRLAQTDDLTGLRNARALWQDLGGLLTGRPAALIFLDLDRFKDINDTHGHAAGDAVLRATGAAVRAVAGPGGHAYRYGGEELVVVLPGAGEPEAAALAEAIRARVALPGAGLPAVTASAGVAAAGAGAPGHQLIDRADAALRRAKIAGRDRVVRASSLGAGQDIEDDATLAARRAALSIAAAALDARDPDTADHSDEVVLLCEAIAARLGIDGLAREHLLAAARLHDVGKVAVPEAILGKAGPLDAEEWAVMRRHTVTGEQIVQAVPELALVAPLVRSAHERYDGGGYPDGLAGEAIPLGSRVIFCADAFHAIRSDRPYRAGRPVADAVAELEANAGTQFDPEVAATLIAVVGEARTQATRFGMRRAMARSPRLMALLLTLALGGSALAAEPHVRHAVRDAVRAVVPAGAHKPASKTVVGAPRGAVLHTALAPAPAGPRSRAGVAAGPRLGPAAASRSGAVTPAPNPPAPLSPAPVATPSPAGDGASSSPGTGSHDSRGQGQGQGHGQGQRNSSGRRQSGDDSGKGKPRGQGKGQGSSGNGKGHGRGKGSGGRD
jgi:diguanylate cyclase (GGDEF)-like protein